MKFSVSVAMSDPSHYGPIAEAADSLGYGYGLGKGPIEKKIEGMKRYADDPVTPFRRARGESSP